MYKAIETTTALLTYTFGFVFIIAGLDKVTNYITTWSDYLWGFLCKISGLAPDTFMLVVGSVEFITGILVLIKPTNGAYAVATWLMMISLTLIGSGEFHDVAIRDIVMAVSAWCLAILSKAAKTSD